LIWSAYFTIPLVILKYLSRKQEIRFTRLYFLFAAFILACGSTHFFDAIAFWIPVYRLNALLRLITGALSWITVFYLVKMLPMAFSLKTEKQLTAEIGQRMMAEENSRQSREQIETIFNAAPDAVIVINGEGDIVNWNPRAELLFGWAKEEVLNRPLGEIVIPERYRELHKKGMRHYLKTGEAQVLGKTVEIQAINREGIEFDVALSISPTVTNGQLLFIGFIRDISEKKRAEEKIRQLNTNLEERVLERTTQLYHSEQKYRHLFENNPMPMWVLDLASFAFLDVNEAAIDHYGYSREEFLHMTALDIRPEEDRELFRQTDHSDALGRGNYNRGIWKHVKKDGTLIYAEVVAHNVSLGNGKARLILSNDVTARVEAEELLRKTIKEIEDYKYALEESSIIAITDQAGIIRHVNENFCKISKYRPEEVIGRDHRVVNSGYHSQEFFKNLWDTIAGGKIWKGEIRNRAKDGRNYWVDTTIVPFLDEHNAPYQYVAIRADITERKEVERQLQLLNEDLENRINRRTIELEATNKEMEAFTYSVSHDLRAPLRGILGFATILEEDYGNKMDEEAQRITGVIKKKTVKMGRLIDDLLEFSRMGRQFIAKSLINTHAMVQEVIDDLLIQYPSPAITWKVQALPDIPGDINTIRQVWINLISNALKYSSGREHPVIEIGSFAHEGQAGFFVKDNGVGFDTRYKDKLFKVFQRLHSADEFEGTGVGLALVAKIIAKHGGIVWAEATVDKGACFYFCLPDT
jgi:PAS domain S-box-containing protein